MNLIQTDQAHVRLNLTAEIAPCDREYQTQFFNMTEAALTVACHLDTEGEAACATGLDDLSTAGDDAESRIAKFVSDRVQEHVVAEGECHQAKNNTADAIVIVQTDQRTWSTEHVQCAQYLGHRDYDICEFGEKLDRVCVSVQEYTEMSTQINTTGNAYSLSDRRDEMETIVLVQCLLTAFQTSGNLTGSDVTACQTAVGNSEDVIGLVITHQTESVASAQTVNGVKCGEQAWTFESGSTTTHSWTVPVFTADEGQAYTQEPSPEDSVTYVSNPDWSSNFMPGDSDHFTECHSALASEDGDASDCKGEGCP